MSASTARHWTSTVPRTLALALALALPVSAQSPAADSAELAVLRLAAPGWLPTHQLVVHPVGLCFFTLHSGTACIADSLRVEFAPALADYARRNSTPAAFPDLVTRTAAALRKPALSSAGRDTTCTANRTLGVGRVGFDSTYQRAVIAFWVGEGSDSHTCGFAAGATMLLRRRPDGVWVIVATPRNWIS